MAAAAIAVFIVARGPGGPESPPVFRGAAELVAVAPIGAVANTPTDFVWTRLASAASYRFMLFGAESIPVFSIVTADTSLSLDNNSVDVPRSGYWVVAPLNDLGLTAGDGVTTPYRVTD